MPVSLAAGPWGSQRWFQSTVGWSQFLTWLAVGPRCPKGGFHTLQCGARFQSCWLRAQSVPDLVSPCWYTVLGSVALGAGVGLLVGDLFPGMAGCRAGVTGCRCLPAGVWSWFWVLLEPGHPGGVQEFVFWAIGGWGWVQGILGAGAYPLMGKTGPGASDGLLWEGTRSQGL